MSGSFRLPGGGEGEGDGDGDGDVDVGGGGGGGGGVAGALQLTTLRRSNSSRLLSESITAECARVAVYERIPDSVRLNSGRVDTGCLGDNSCIGDLELSGGKKGSKALAVLGKIFTLRKPEDGGTKGSPEKASPEKAAETEEKKLKKRSSWLPDPEKRWPVQGWS